MSTVLQYHGVGRRKTSVARVWIRPGSGNWEINSRTTDHFFTRPSLQQHAQEPLSATNLQGRFDVKVLVDGGGQTGQAGAIRARSSARSRADRAPASASSSRSGKQQRTVRCVDPHPDPHPAIHTLPDGFAGVLSGGRRPEERSGSDVRAPCASSDNPRVQGGACAE